MLRRLLIANRGEIACRVIRTARQLGIRCLAVYSDADRDALHTTMADEAYRIGPPPARESYLDAAAILSAAERAGADAIHPGYGFLSENPDFAEACAERGIAFVGPPADALRAMGSKSEAKRILTGAGVPLVPGYHGDDQSPERLAREAEATGWPVLLKAAAGGGGRGMRAVERAEDFAVALAGARREARAAFGDEKMLIERYLTEPRHVEVQVFADRHGNFVHLFERDCSAQRRHQKVVEEAPAPGVGGALRDAMYEAALTAARAIGYVGAGTVEFLLERDGRRFWFMEMNTRLQVEHPVTELVTGTDLVEWQLRVARGEPLPVGQDAIAVRGHAIEARLYAEDPRRGFLPSTGRLVHLRLPAEEGGERMASSAGTGSGADPGAPAPAHPGAVTPAAATATGLASGDVGVRVDTGVRAGDTVSMHYDPMMAKIIAWGPDRAVALDRLADALAATEVVGPTANVELLCALVTHPRFRAAEVHTRFIEDHLDELRPPDADAGTDPDGAGDEDLAIAAWAVAAAEDRRRGASRGDDPWSPWQAAGHWRLNGVGERIVRLRAGSEVHAVTVSGGGGRGYRAAAGTYRLRLPAGAETTISGAPAEDGDGRWRIAAGGRHSRASIVPVEDRYVVFRNGRRRELTMHDPGAVAGGLEMAGGLTAPMPGRIVSVLVGPGQSVREGQALLVLEAMKMEHTLTAPADGTVEEVRFAPGDLVDEATELVVLAAAAADRPA